MHAGNGAERRFLAHTESVAPADIQGSLERIDAEATVSRLLQVATAELTQLLDASRVSVSRTIGDLLVELTHHDAGGAVPPLELFLVTDYPLTQEVIEKQEPRTVVVGDPDADPAESALLERLGFGSLLMLPLRSRGQNWGLVEIWANRRFSADEIAHATTVVERVGDSLAVLEQRA